jgi:hypothetical protein
MAPGSRAQLAWIAATPPSATAQPAAASASVAAAAARARSRFRKRPVAARPSARGANVAARHSLLSGPTPPSAARRWPCASTEPAPMTTKLKATRSARPAAAASGAPVAPLPSAIASTALQRDVEYMQAEARSAHAAPRTALKCSRR